MKEKNVYSLLNQDTKAWWYNKQLRSMGQDKEARKRERQSLRNHVNVLRDTIRNKGFLLIPHEGRFVLYIGPFHTLSGYHDDAIKLCCFKLGIPVYELPENDSSLLIMREPEFSECRKYYKPYQI